MRNTIVILTLLWATCGSNAHAQELKEDLKTIIKAVKVKYDSTYISKPRRLTLKVFGTRNYLDYKLIDKHVDETITYRANTPLNIGLGASYRGIGLSFSIRTGLVKKYEQYGKTKSFDLSTQIFLPKIAIDIYGKYYRGYYITDPSSILNNTPEDASYIRPDLRNAVIGISGEYILNAKKFSFSSPYSQTQIQKKSAGSFLFGAGAFALLINADSSIIPAEINNIEFFKRERFNKSNIYSIIVNGGYAYTLVIHKKYFVSGSLNLGGGLSYATLSDAATKSRDGKIGTQLDMAFRLGAGYNYDRYFAGLQYTRLVTKNVTPVKATHEYLGAGSVRIVFARRFKFRQKTIDHALNSISK